MVGVSGLGVVATFDGTPVDGESLTAIAEAAPYRGMDGSGSWFGQGVGVVQQLLRTVAGEAPAPHVEGNLVVVADARIDNRGELLAALRVDDRTCSDAALLAAAYRRWGPRCAARIVGDFAFVVWDDRERCLFAARDPMAMRSLAYHVVSGRRVVAATEVKQVLAAPGVPGAVDETSVAADLVGHYGRADWTAYRSIRQLAPGHVLEIDARGYRTWRFWAPDPAHRIVHRDPRDYAEQLRALFLEAVSARLRTSWPVGILLSGGVDSCSVAAAAGWLIERGEVSAPSLNGSTWAFDELTQCDERDVARHLVERFGLGWHQTPGDRRGPGAGFPAHGPPRDEPFVGPFQPLIDDSLAALRRMGSRIVLGGDRGDLVIGWTGFRHLDLVRQRRLSALRDELDQQRAATGDRTHQLIWRHLGAPGFAGLGRRVVRPWMRASARHPVATAHLIPPWLNADLVMRTGLVELVTEGEPSMDGFGFSRALRREAIFTQLHVRGMAWSERSYAAHGLGFADPFSDRRVVEFALAVPQAVINVPGATSKPLMRAAMHGIMPPAALREARKVVPQPLFDRALARDSAAVVRALLTDMATEARGWVRAQALREHHADWLAGSSLRPDFWNAAVTEWWVRDHLR